VLLCRHGRCMRAVCEDEKRGGGKSLRRDDPAATMLLVHPSTSSRSRCPGSRPTRAASPAASSSTARERRAAAVRHGLTSAQYQATFDQLVAQGYRLELVNGYSVAGQDRFAAIWTK